MSNREHIITERLATNLADVMDNGPRLSTLRSTWIKGKDTAAGKVLVGGLGCMGVGTMWSTASEHYLSDPTYADAPEMTYPGSPFGFGWPA